MNHAISINSDKTLVITLPEGTQVDRVMIRKMGTQESKLYWRDEVLDQYKWERDIAIQQLKELGYGFGQEPKRDGDTISRQAAIDAFAKFLSDREGGNKIWWKPVAESVVDALPPAEPELANNSKELDNENGELNSRHAAIDAVSEACFELRGVFGRCEDALKALPSAQPRKGKWLPDNTNYYDERYICSECNANYKVDTCMGKPSWNFCPNCGADMRGEKE